jgi:hypothetical protein
MSKNAERWWLASAWALIAACGVSGVLRIQSRSGAVPEPAFFEAGANRPPKPASDPTRKAWDRFHRSQDVIGPIRVPVTPYVGYLIPEIILGPSRPEGPGIQFILPRLIYSGKAGMDRVTLTWSLEEPKLTTTKEVIQKRAGPRALVIHRQTELGEFEPVAVLDPTAKSFEDRGVEPNHSYRYWVLVRGEEGVDRGRVSTVRTVDQEGVGEAEVRIPSWHRVALKGGDREHAILAVDSYNPQVDRWESRTVLAAPGQKIPGTGWTLEGMRFDRSTLWAEVRDDRQEKRDLSTKKKE